MDNAISVLAIERKVGGHHYASVLLRREMAKGSDVGPPGGGATQIIMPYLTTAIATKVPEFVAWRWAFFVPGAMHVIVAFLIMFVATVGPPLAPKFERAGQPSPLETAPFGPGLPPLRLTARHSGRPQVPSRKRATISFQPSG